MFKQAKITRKHHIQVTRLSCRELLSRLLVRCPEKRISFSDFFSHPVLDLAHLPGPDTLATGTQLAAAAVLADRAGRLEEVLHCTAALPAGNCRATHMSTLTEPSSPLSISRSHSASTKLLLN